MTASDVRPTGDWDGSAFAHEAFLYASDEELLARCVPFVEEGSATDQTVVVMAAPETLEALHDTIGGAGDGVLYVASSDEWWQGGHATLHAWARTLEPLRRRGRPWRLIGQPAWLGDERGRVWSRFEAAVNDGFADYSYYSLCLHDLRAVGAEVAADALRTHPLTWDGRAPAASPTYVPPQDFLHAVEPTLSPAPDGASVVPVSDVRAVRRHLADAIAGAGLDDRADDVVLAVHELLINAVRVAERVVVTTWRDGWHLVCEVTDDGPGFPVGAAGYCPPDDTLDRGRGLWLARSLADDSTVRSDEGGTRARLYFRAS